MPLRLELAAGGRRHGDEAHDEGPARDDPRPPPSWLHALGKEPARARGKAFLRRSGAAAAAGAFALTLAGAPAAAAADTLDDVRARGVLRWGADLQGGEPFVYTDPDDPARETGFEVELAELLARGVGAARAERVQSDWSLLVPALERGDFDVALNGLEVTVRRAERVLFTRPYFVFGARLLARRDDARALDRLEALRGLRVGTLSQSFGFELLRRVTEPVGYEGCLEPYADLAEGRLDAVLLDDVIAARYGEPNPRLRVAADLAEGAYAVGIRPEDARLRDALDAALAEATRSGALRAILAPRGLYGPRQEALARSGRGPAPLARAEDAAPDAPGAPATSLGGHARRFARAAGTTLLLSTSAMGLAVALGLGLALARAPGRPRALRAAAAGYVELFRGTPVLLQLFVLYYGLAPWLRLPPLACAVLGLGLNYAAYEAEVYRAGLAAVPPGQVEAARALGMTRAVTLRRVVLPQALRIALPGVTNDFVALLKDSAVVSFVAVVELTKQASITAVDLRSWALPGVAAAALYLAMSLPLAHLARRLEARLAGADEAADEPEGGEARARGAEARR